MPGAATSSARGLFQFIEQTWLATMKQAGSALGYGRYADAISQTASGQIRSQRPGAAQRDSQAAQRPDRERGDGRGLHQGQCGCPEPAARPRTQRGRALHRAFSRRRRRRAADRARRQQSERQRLGLFLARGAGQFLDFLRSQTGAARSVAQVRDILTARYDVARRNQPEAARPRRRRHRPLRRRHRRRIPPALPTRSPPVSKLRPTAAALPTRSPRSCRRRRSPIDRSSRCSTACSPTPARSGAARAARERLVGRAKCRRGIGGRAAVPGGLLDLFRDPVAKDT